ncbi:MAG TPA: DUF881 domain-containing protein [Candidatus Limnocylindria bacterium]|nr:DUF881 domain-containing protein [Candidatus Limnocylindria bacterium]
MTPPPAVRVDTEARRDPALGLLDRLVRDALDQGYLEAASRREAAGADAVPSRGRRTRWFLALGLALVTLVITVAAVDQVAGAPDVTSRKNQLAGAITDATARVDGLEADVRGRTAEVAALRSARLSSGSEGQALQAQLDDLGVSVGTVSAVGPGVVVTVDDAPADTDAVSQGEPDLGRVLDRDLQIVVNGLWEAGSEAVDINGQRLTSLTAIRGAGDAVLVNYRPLVRPYVITAIGDPATLAARFGAGPAGVELEVLRQTYGVRYDLESRREVTVPGEPGVQVRYAEEDLG